MKRLPWLCATITCLWAGSAAAQDPAPEQIVPEVQQTAENQVQEADEQTAAVEQTADTAEPPTADTLDEPPTADALDEPPTADALDEPPTADALDEPPTADALAPVPENANAQSDVDAPADSEDEAPGDNNEVNQTTYYTRQDINEIGWHKGIALFFGLEPNFDLRDSATGYSARIGFDAHARYCGVGLQVTWNSLWANGKARRIDHDTAPYKSTNSGLMANFFGYVPFTDSFVLKLGAGIGLGKRYETIFSDKDIKYDGSSWLSRLEVGALWQFENDVTIGLDFEFNFGNYITPEGPIGNYRIWSDKEDDISLGLVLNVSYQFRMKNNNKAE